MLLAGGDRTRALDLHEWNTQLNAALLHDFAHLEVGLRNGMGLAWTSSAVKR